MLLSSILQILAGIPTPSEETPAAPQAAEKPSFEQELAAASQEPVGLEKIQQEIAAAAGLLTPLNTAAEPPAPRPGPSLEGLLQTLTKFNEADQSRVVDVFE